MRASAAHPAGKSGDAELDSGRTSRNGAGISGFPNVLQGSRAYYELSRWVVVTRSRRVKQQALRLRAHASTCLMRRPQTYRPAFLSGELPVGSFINSYRLRLVMRMLNQLIVGKATGLWWPFPSTARTPIMKLSLGKNANEALVTLPTGTM